MTIDHQEVTTNDIQNISNYLNRDHKKSLCSCSHNLSYCTLLAGEYHWGEGGQGARAPHFCEREAEPLHTNTLSFYKLLRTDVSNTTADCH